MKMLSLYAKDRTQEKNRKKGMVEKKIERKNEWKKKKGSGRQHAQEVKHAQIFQFNTAKL
jgi:hypothetical protein